jgi:hypothetical protein
MLRRGLTGRSPAGRQKAIASVLPNLSLSLCNTVTRLNLSQNCNTLPLHFRPVQVDDGAMNHPIRIYREVPRILAIDNELGHETFPPSASRERELKAERAELVAAWEAGQ